MAIYSFSHVATPKISVYQRAKREVMSALDLCHGLVVGEQSENVAIIR